MAGLALANHSHDLVTPGTTVEDIAREYGTVLGEVEAREFLASVDEQAGRPSGQYSEPTLQLIATNLMLGQIGQSEESAAAVEERFAERVSGRFTEPSFPPGTGGRPAPPSRSARCPRPLDGCW